MSDRLLIPQLAILFCGATLAACADQSPEPAPLLGRDVSCLQRSTEAGQDFRAALAGCGTTKPDLTGSQRLQQLAIDNRIPFTIRPDADAQIKAMTPYVQTGSLLSGIDTPQSSIYRYAAPPIL